MINQLPEHVEVQLRILIEEGLPPDQIAFMLRIDKNVVEEAINTTKRESPGRKARG